MSNARDQFYANAFYHISNKSFDNGVLWRTNADFKTFMLYIITNLLEYPSLVMTSYCLLPNHFHFVIKNGESGFKISEFMRKIQVSYAMYFKKNNPGIKGLPVFKGRFKSTQILSQDELSKVEYYVNHNAVIHSVVSKLADWPYSSIHQLTKTGYEYNNETHIRVYSSIAESSESIDFPIPEYEP